MPIAQTAGAGRALVSEVRKCLEAGVHARITLFCVWISLLTGRSLQ